MQTVKILYTIVLACLALFSYAFVDINFPLPPNSNVWDLVSVDRSAKLFLYLLLLAILYSIYIYLIHSAKILSSKIAWRLIFLISGILLFSFPAFSYDIFNYIATSKVVFLYRENPYILMPIEFTREPMLSFMHAANKTALYGPAWIILSVVPYLAGFGNLIATLFTFKFFVSLFYLATCYLIWIVSKRNLTSLILFALNPLVIIETLVSGHNDIVMMFFALLSFYLLPKKLYIFSVSAIIISVLIKYATLFLIPIYIYVFVSTVRNIKINWDTVWFYSFISMLVVFLLSPIREEMYSWYFIWPFTFLVLTKNYILIKYVSIALSVGLLLRFAPFIYFGSWGDPTPLIKMVATWGSPIIGYVVYLISRRLA